MFFVTELMKGGGPVLGPAPPRRHHALGPPGAQGGHRCGPGHQLPAHQVPPRFPVVAGGMVALGLPACCDCCVPLQQSVWRVQACTAPAGRRQLSWGTPCSGCSRRSHWDLSRGACPAGRPSHRNLSMQASGLHTESHMHCLGCMEVDQGRGLIRCGMQAPAHDAPRPQEPERAAERGGRGQDSRRGHGQGPSAGPGHRPACDDAPLGCPRGAQAAPAPIQCVVAISRQTLVVLLGCMDSCGALWSIRGLECRGGSLQRPPEAVHGDVLQSLSRSERCSRVN